MLIFLLRLLNLCLFLGDILHTGRLFYKTHYRNIYSLLIHICYLFDVNASSVLDQTVLPDNHLAHLLFLLLLQGSC